MPSWTSRGCTFQVNEWPAKSKLSFNYNPRESVLLPTQSPVSSVHWPFEVLQASSVL